MVGIIKQYQIRLWYTGQYFGANFPRGCDMCDVVITVPRSAPHKWSTASSKYMGWLLYTWWYYWCALSHVFSTVIRKTWQNAWHKAVNKNIQSQFGEEYEEVTFRPYLGTRFTWVAAGIGTPGYE